MQWKQALVKFIFKHNSVILKVPKFYDLIKFEQEMPQKLSHGPSVETDYLLKLMSVGCFFCFFLKCHCPDKHGKMESADSVERKERGKEIPLQILIKIPVEIVLALFQRGGLKRLIQIPVNHLLHLTGSRNLNRCKSCSHFTG